MKRNVVRHTGPPEKPEPAGTGSTLTSEEEFEYDTIRLNSTCYDGTAIALATAFDPSYAEKHGAVPTIITFVFALSLHLISIALQFFMVYGLLVTTVADKESPYRRSIDTAIGLVGAAIESDPPAPLSHDVPWEDEALQLCAKRQNLATSHFLIVFLWATRMSAEVVDALKRFRMILRLPAADWDEPILEEEPSENDTSGKFLIARATVLVRVIFIITISCPQTLACIFLTWTGSKFLLYTGDMGTLIMKSIGIAFIATLDELMYSTFATAKFQALVSRTSFKIYAGKTNIHMEMWGWSMVKILIVLLYTIFIWLIVFSKITEFRHLCDLYGAKYGKQSKPSAWTEFLAAMNVI